MNQTALFWPLIAQVLLVFIVYALLSARRHAAVRSGDARWAQFRENRDEPAESLFVANNLLNQFQLPVLFYVVVLCLYVTQGGSIVTVALAWLFVVSRYLHAAVHVTSNRLSLRSPLFAAGYIILAALWVWFALHLLTIV